MCSACGFVDVGGNKVNKLYCRCKICKQLLRRQRVCNGCNAVGSALPDMYARCPQAHSARGRVRTYQVMHDLQCCN